MNKAERRHQLFNRLAAAGISFEDATALRRIEMTLSRWGELECGDANGNAIERDEVTEKPYYTYDLGQNGKRGRTPVADREKGALKRLAAIMARYPELLAYHQTDPRGCALYIVKRSDVPKLTRREWIARNPVDVSAEAFKRANARQIESYYTRGIAVCA